MCADLQLDDGIDRRLIEAAYDSGATAGRC